MEKSKNQGPTYVVKMQCPNCRYNWIHYIPKSTRMPKIPCPRCGWLNAKPGEVVTESQR